VQKEINIIRAVFNKAIIELRMNVRNPFESLSIPNVGKDADKRDTFTIDELKAILKVSIERDDDIRRLVILQLFTGSRISEVAGLKKEDVRLNEAVPYVMLEENEKRRLKTGNSVRVVPLVEPALEAVKKQLKVAEGGCLFPRYNQQEKTSGDAASAAVNKYLKGFTEGVNKTSHCFRHTLEDLLRDADVTRDVKDELTGHRNQSMSDNYGKGSALSKKLEALNKAYKEVL
jgi:integrase